jgi:hypothetical protein
LREKKRENRRHPGERRDPGGRAKRDGFAILIFGKHGLLRRRDFLCRESREAPRNDEFILPALVF